ncbi:MAG: phosphonoacetaldehyde hydrolase [Desulfatiglandaceae bacterium]
MPMIHRNKPYSGAIKAVVLDWSGTAVDFGSIGPAAAFVKAFAKFGVEVTVAEVRQFMGLAKKDHLRNICGLPSVIDQWRKKTGSPPNEIDVERLFAETEPMLIATVTQYAEPIPGLIETVKSLRRQGVKIGSSTGYTAPIMEALVPAARAKGYAPEAVVCATDVPAGRPYPWMCYLNAIQLQVYPLEAVVKIGDTLTDIEAGLNAGMWSIGLTQSGNELGLSREEASRLSADEMHAGTKPIARRFRDAGAHDVVAGIWEVMPAIETINTRLARGEMP